MGSEYVANKQQSEPLALRLGGEEGREKVVGHRWRYALSIVGDDEC